MRQPGSDTLADALEVKEGKVKVKGEHNTNNTRRVINLKKESGVVLGLSITE